MSSTTDTERAPVETPAEQAAPLDLATPDRHNRPQNSRTVRRLPIEMIGMAAALIATIIMYTLFIVHPVAHEPLDQFLAMFGRFNAAVWPMQLVGYAAAVAMIALALSPMRRSTQAICLLAAANLAWVGIAFFGVLDSGMNLAWLWATTFVLEGLLFVVAGIVRRDLVFAPRWNLTSVLGGVLMFYALVAYPIIGLLRGEPLHTLPVFGLSPCATVIFYFGLLLWARRPAPMYLLLLPLAWALNATPSNLAMGHAADFGLALAGIIAAGVFIWRDSTSSWQVLAAWLLLTLMIVFSGQDIVLIGIALVLTAVTLVQTIRGDTHRSSPAGAHPTQPPAISPVEHWYSLWP